MKAFLKSIDEKVWNFIEYGWEKSTTPISKWSTSLVEVHRSSAKFHGLFFPVFIHRILLDLGLEDFPISELVHIIASIGATFLRQRVAQLKASSKRHRVECFTGDASRPPPSGDPSTETYVDPTAAVDQIGRAHV